jgi:N-glycosidase YbiA
LKFEGHAYVEEIRQAPHPDKAKLMGQTRSVPLRADWEAVKEKVMLEALEAKFSQHAELKELLLSTGNKLIVERTKNDSYWGDGGDYSGKNRLGYCLMQVRNKLSSQ